MVRSISHISGTFECIILTKETHMSQYKEKEHKIVIKRNVLCLNVWPLLICWVWLVCNKIYFCTNNSLYISNVVTNNRRSKTMLKLVDGKVILDLIGKISNSLWFMCVLTCNTLPYFKEILFVTNPKTSDMLKIQI